MGLGQTLALALALTLPQLTLTLTQQRRRLEMLPEVLVALVVRSLGELAHLVRVRVRVRAGVRAGLGLGLGVGGERRTRSLEALRRRARRPALPRPA